MQQRSDVLVDVVIARAFPEIFGVLVVVLSVKSVIFARSSGFSFMFDLGRILVRPALATGPRGIKTIPA